LGTGEAVTGSPLPHHWTCRSARRLCNLNPRWSEARFLLRSKSFASLQVSVSVSPSSEPVKLQLIGWRHVTRKHDALPFTPTVCALLTWVSQKHSGQEERGPFGMKIEVTKEARLGDVANAALSTPSGVTRVLIVDDELTTRKLLAAVLGEAGVQCKTAACAEEGLRVLETESVDAVLSDLQMPGISGMEFLAQVRLRYRHLVFLMITGVDDIQVGIEAMKRVRTTIS
jgi:CheY-like chemotaxis protein